MSKSEGYVKYSDEHTIAPAIDAPHWKELNDARTRLHQLGLVGVLPNGVGFGNLSIRIRENEFLISGTATGEFPVLGNDKYCLVESFDLAQNHVVSSGPVRPSSESMTHGAVFKSNPRVNSVIHVHSRRIFDGMARDHYPATPADAPYGTPEIALAIENCVRDLNGDEGRIVMLGHDEGVIAYGPSVERTLALILELYDKYRP